MLPFRIPTRWPICAAVLLLLSLSAGSAAVSYDIAVGLDINEDTRIFMNLTNQTWDTDPELATVVVHESRHPEHDFPVVAFLAYHSHRSPHFILSLRNKGYGWADIFFRLEVNPSVLFVGMDRDPGPPYGKAWGHWKKNPHRGGKTKHRLSDQDVVGLVKVQTASRHFGISPRQIIEAQKQGKRVETYSANRWRNKHGKKGWNEKPGVDHTGNPGQGKAESHDSSGKGNQKSKGKGNKK